MNNTDTRPRRPSDLLTVRVFLVALAGLLAGYMFMGRGFAHVGMRPIFIGEVVLVLGLVATAYAIVRLRIRPNPSPIVWLLIAFMVLGAARTVPYLGVYGVDALRDAVLWGYAFFALFIYVLADRALVLTALRAYGWVVPVFALWLPISLQLFLAMSVSIDPNAPGSTVPIVFFKSGDMVTHVVGSIAFLVIGTGLVATIRASLWRTLVSVSFAWTAFVSVTNSRGAFLASFAGLTVVAILALVAQKSRNWLPVFAGTLVLATILAAPGLIGALPAPVPTATPTAVASESPSPVPSPSPTTSSQTPTPTAIASPAPTEAPTPVVTPKPAPSGGRATSLDQLLVNIGSIFGNTSVDGLDGTRRFRLAWWTKIVDYTVFGPYFWLGKGFGVNLADDDGFQTNADGSLRAPHNSHLTALARMGVPGFVLWILLQGAFSIGLLRSVLSHRRAGDVKVAAVGAWILAYWTAMMVTTSFDPYLEGPQGGIWFWSLIGLGLVVMRLTPQPRET